jgi:hypothetical protein
MSKFVGTGPSCYEKRIYRAAVSQSLRNAAVEEVAMHNFGLKYWHLSGGQVCAGTHGIILEWFTKQ